jgi:hypothetical protein
MMRIIRENQLQKTAEEILDSDSILAKVAFGLEAPGADSVLSFLAAQPPSNVEQLREIMGAYLEDQLQQKMSPPAAQARQIQAMADLIDARIILARRTMEFAEQQAKMNPAAAAGAQMPMPGGIPGTPNAGQPPGLPGMPGAPGPMPMPQGPQGPQAPPLPQSPMEAAGGTEG